VGRDLRHRASASGAPSARAAASSRPWVREPEDVAPVPLPSPTPAEPAVLRFAPVTVESPGFWSWALLNRHTGEMHGSANWAKTNKTASMIKAWIAADYLRRQSERAVKPSRSSLDEVSRMIRDSDNEAAEDLYHQIGQDAAIRRLISICKLTDTVPGGGYWSRTSISARDTARMGQCIADGRGAGPVWTPWLVNEMRHVRGYGTFGIRPELPDSVTARTAIKNGWLDRDEDHEWNINCMAIVDDDWVLAVLTRYDDGIGLGMGHGVGICGSVTRQLLAG
jgi:hypothetical protein